MNVIWKCQLAATRVADLHSLRGKLRANWTTPGLVTPILQRAGEFPHKALRVLVLVEEIDTAKTIMSITRRAGHRALPACTEVAALELAITWQPNVVFLDLQMRQADCCDVALRLERLKSDQDRFIIAYSDRVDQALRQRCNRAGINLLLGKPVDLRLLRTLLILECELVNQQRKKNTPTPIISCDFMQPKRNAKKSRMFRHEHQSGNSLC